MCVYLLPVNDYLLQVVSDKSIIATVTVLSLVISEFVVVVGEYAFFLLED